jgi:hypothetical protein
MRAIFAIPMLLVACGPGGYDLEPITVDDECYTLDCPLLAGGEVFARAIYFTDYDQLVRARSVSVAPPELATASVDGEYIVIRPAAFRAGTDPYVGDPAYGVLTVTLPDGAEFERTFTVAPRFATSVVPDRNHVPMDLFPERKLPGERLAMFDGEAVVVYAEHRTIDGQRLLGHNDDGWTAEGVQLAEIQASYGQADTALVRRVRGLATGTGSVALGAATLPLDIVPPRSAARIDIVNPHASSIAAGSMVHAYVGSVTTVRVLAYAADGRYIYGGPPFLPVVVTSSDPSIVRLDDRAITADRDLRLEGYGSGTATLTVSFDGLSTDVPVTVE